LASPTETRVGVALEAAFVVVSASTCDTSMNKSSSAVGFLMVVVKTVVHFRHGSVGAGDAGQVGSGVKTNPIIEVAAAVVAGPPFDFPGGVVGFGGLAPKASKQNTTATNMHIQAINLRILWSS
jgi:hypothetical protein